MYIYIYIYIYKILMFLFCRVGYDIQAKSQCCDDGGGDDGSDVGGCRGDIVFVCDVFVTFS